MDARTESDVKKNATLIERKSDRELVTTRTFDGPARLVFQAWTTPELFKKWWVPKSAGLTLLSYEADIRTGGTYRLVFDAKPQPMAFFGRYLEVVQDTRIVWTNEEGGPGGPVTTVTLEEKGGRTLLVMTDLFPSKEALDEAISSGSTSTNDETFSQLAELLTSMKQ